MALIEDYLQPLHEGVWEVSIPKEQVSHPPGPEWQTSQINVPTPGTIASFRKGQYHLHETKTEYKIHLDRYDPKVHPFLHLIDDAPLLLMISETFITLISMARRTSVTDIAQQLHDQVSTYRTHLIQGFLIILLGCCFILVPDIIFTGLTRFVIPAIVFIAGIVTLYNGLSFHPLRCENRNDLFRGVGIIILSLILSILPVLFWVAAVLFVIAVWMFASSVILLKRIIRGRKAVPEGFFSRLLISLGSLGLGIISIIEPTPVFYFFLDILGVLTIVAGSTLTLVGITLRNMMNTSLPARDTG